MERLSLVTLHPFAKGNLTSDGIQWSAEVTTTDANWTALETKTITVPMAPGAATEPIVEVEFALTYSIKSTGATKHVKHKAQARNTGGTWVDLYAEQTRAADASAYLEYTFSGRFATVANFQTVAFDVQVVIKREDAGENAVGKMKNSSYARTIYSDS